MLDRLVLAAARPPVVERVTMTPEMASKLLTKMTKQRPLNERRVDRYAAQMESGEWDAENPQGCTTIVAKNGGTLDSQHRLEAIVRSGRSIPWILITNVNPRARATMDIGRSWTPGDYLASLGVSHANRTASVAKIIYSAEKATYEADPSSPKRAMSAIIEGTMSIDVERLRAVTTIVAHCNGPAEPGMRAVVLGKTWKHVEARS